MGIFRKLGFGLKKTRDNMSGKIEDVLGAYEEINDDLFDELEEALVMGDVGIQTAQDIVEELRKRVNKNEVRNPKHAKIIIQEIVSDMLQGGEDMGLVTIPSIILLIGVNGVGKTTTIGKMAAQFKAQGKKVILGAADTFRAAAIDQLEIWAQRAGVDMIKHAEGSDPAAVVFDTINAGIARDCDIIICDTAGRLHNKKNLMDELAKIYRVIDRELPWSDREILLCLDATTGQNAVNQAREFMNVAEITGIVLTKLDGTARGGVVLAINNELDVPVKFVGVGEQIDDLQPFNPQAFADGLFQKIEYEEDENESEKITENILGDIRSGVDGHGDSADEDKHSDKEAVSSSQEEKAEQNNGSRSNESGVSQLQQTAQIIDELAVEMLDEVMPSEENAEENAEISNTEEAVNEEKDEPDKQEEKKEKKEKRGFFGLFNRHS